MGALADLLAFNRAKDYATEQGQQYEGLLNQYRVPGDPNTPNPGPYALGQPEMQQAQMQQQGGYRQASGLLGAAPPSDFFTRAAAIGPAYSGLATGAQSNIGAMERQMQGQYWESNNMSLAQKTSLDQQYQQQKWARERQEFEYNNLSAAQKASNALGWAGNAVAQGNLGVAQQGIALRQQEAQTAQQQAQREAMFPALGLKGQPAMDYRAGIAKMDNAAAISTDVADYLQNIGAGGKAIDRGTVNAMQAAYQQHVVPALTTMVGTGTIQKGDMEFVQGVMGDPGAWSSLDSRERQKVMQILTSVNDERGRLYGLSGVQAPPVKPGGSAWARSRGSVKPPEDVQWGP